MERSQGSAHENEIWEHWDVIPNEVDVFWDKGLQFASNADLGPSKLGRISPHWQHGVGIWIWYPETKPIGKKI